MKKIQPIVDSLNICGRHLLCHLCHYREHRSDNKCRLLLLLDCARLIYGDESPVVTQIKERLE